ncbi:hypothetical protein Mcup_1099 [Metallosphaera cuprina Ar-4]|uniref:Uncharacterized protein n=1 Tax=Metallosphaera cuprina (strain Ar-4) TaxID=1006006 RepID=F4G306_METCR|nr:hypothetical protein Mcup_1099 [Metallosphaera cuprina Ar-4]
MELKVTVGSSSTNYTYTFVESFMELKVSKTFGVILVFIVSRILHGVESSFYFNIHYYIFFVESFMELKGM